MTQQIRQQQPTLDAVGLRLRLGRHPPNSERADREVSPEAEEGETPSRAVPFRAGHSDTLAEAPEAVAEPARLAHIEEAFRVRPHGAVDGPIRGDDGGPRPLRDSREVQ